MGTEASLDSGSRIKYGTSFARMTRGSIFILRGADGMTDCFVLRLGAEFLAMTTVCGMLSGSAANDEDFQILPPDSALSVNLIPSKAPSIFEGEGEKIKHSLSVHGTIISIASTTIMGFAGPPGGTDAAGLLS